MLQHHRLIAESLCGMQNTILPDTHALGQTFVSTLHQIGKLLEQWDGSPEDWDEMLQQFCTPLLIVSGEQDQDAFWGDLSPHVVWCKSPCAPNGVQLECLGNGRRAGVDTRLRCCFTKGTLFVQCSIQLVDPTSGIQHLYYAAVADQWGAPPDATASCRSGSKRKCTVGAVQPYALGIVLDTQEL
jgi:hypothetical protein